MPSSKPEKSSAAPVWERDPASVALLQEKPELLGYWRSLSEALARDPGRAAPNPPFLWRAKRNAAQGALVAALPFLLIGVLGAVAAVGAIQLLPGMRDNDKLLAPGRWLKRLSDSWRGRYDAFLERSGETEALSEAFASHALSLRLEQAMRVAEHPAFDPLARARKPLAWLRGPSEHSPPGRGAAPAQIALAFLALNAFGAKAKRDPRIAGDLHVKFFRRVALAQEARELRESVAAGAAAARGAPTEKSAFGRSKARAGKASGLARPAQSGGSLASSRAAAPEAGAEIGANFGAAGGLPAAVDPGSPQESGSFADAPAARPKTRRL